MTKQPLTDEQIEMISNTLSETDPEPVNESDYDKYTDTEETYVEAAIDPVTGNILNINNAIDIDSSDKEIDEILESIEAEEVSVDDIDIKAVVSNKYNLDITDEDVNLLYKALKVVQDGSKVSYNDMPLFVRSEISKTIIDMSNEKNALYVGNKELKNQMAREFINTVYEDGIGQVFESTMMNLQSKIDTYGKKAISDLCNDKFSKQREVLEKETLRIASEIENEKPDDAAMLRSVSKAFHDSYTYEKMFDECKASGKLKVKKIDIEKKNRVYSEFDYKYSKTKNTIKSVSLVEPILRRHLPEDISDESITKFVIIFCKYSTNMDPNKITDHIFMYYFIANIIALDILPHNDGADSFYDDIISNIVKFIDKITYNKK